ncbi:MBL fold metallo-hydrolase [Gracilibacillus caseinilyticus]|uniref:MBL fold metallo-hydrolase n=1 Tax=Gracilibacillus caseinilyticus TaxID=2932256 RepID=A0ABY4EQH0_9BACI|nr:MBL fold metallo-hydrolase [Gracilibacillus caseinilyticus]UOQ46701.1 MBL fold metallo-hydrolase [Gracilibacillus caseinilyticus]
MNIIPLGIWGGYPKANSATSSFLIEEGGFRLLFDCGSGVLSSLQNHIHIQQLDAVIVTHYHHDHIADIGALQYAKLIQNQLADEKKTLPIYAHNREDSFQTLTFKDHTKAVDITQTNQIGPFAIQTIKTNHPVYCLAVRIEANGKSVVLTADTGWEPALIDFSEKADLLISEANLYMQYEGQIPGHMTGRQAGLLAKEADVEQLLLTHLPHFGEAEDLVKEAQRHFSKNVSLAQPGKSYPFV